ncbi:MAG: hypothetical protein IPP74_03885 [Alphaproteobacteria bacterium]|nr:hypothetical protein [Alphaproteobacteria bacterium]
MSKSSDNGDLDVFTLSDRTLYRWLDSQDDGWNELPDDQELARLDYTSKRKRLARIGKPLRSLVSRRRRYAYQSE